MAVKRVILQHFSMKYDYMTKERPNIYQPSRAKFQLGADDDDDDVSKMKDVNDDADEEEDRTPRGSDFSSTGSGSEESVSPKLQPSELMPPPLEPPSKPPMHSDGGSGCSLNGRSGNANNTNWRSVDESSHHQHNRSLDTSTNSALLDSIIELKEKLPDTYKSTTVRKISDGGQQQRPLVSRGSQYASNGNVGFYAPSNRSIVAPTVTLKGVPVENWRYRSSNSSAYRSGRQSGNNNYNDTVPYGGGGGGGRRQRYNNGQGVGGGYNSYHSSTNNTSPQEIRNWRNECMNNSASRNCNMAAASAILGARRGPRGSLIEVERRGSDASDVSCEYLGVGLSPPSESLLMQRRLRLNSRSSDIGPLGCSVPQVQTVSG